MKSLHFYSAVTVSTYFEKSFSLRLAKASLLSLLDETEIIFVLLSFLLEYSFLLVWIHRGTLHNPVVPHYLQKEKNNIQKETETLRSTRLCDSSLDRRVLRMVDCTVYELCYYAH